MAFEQQRIALVDGKQLRRTSSLWKWLKEHAARVRQMIWTLYGLLAGHN
jgi:hypothetical protein